MRGHSPEARLSATRPSWQAMNRTKEPEIECSGPTWLVWARAGGACRQQASITEESSMHAATELACCPGACRVVAWASVESPLSLALTGAAGLDFVAAATRRV